MSEIGRAPPRATPLLHGLVLGKNDHCQPAPTNYESWGQASMPVYRLALLGDEHRHCSTPCRVRPLKIGWWDASYQLPTLADNDPAVLLQGPKSNTSGPAVDHAGKHRKHDHSGKHRKHEGSRKHESSHKPVQPPDVRARALAAVLGGHESKAQNSSAPEASGKHRPAEGLKESAPGQLQPRYIYRPAVLVLCLGTEITADA